MDRIDLKEFTKEDIVKNIVRLLRSGIQFEFATDYADLIESGRWLDMDIWDMVEHNEQLYMGQKMQLNPDPAIVSAIKHRLAVTNGYCPCAPEHMEDPDYKCPCKKFREQKECCCELYVPK